MIVAVFCAAALGLILAGAFHVFRAQNALKTKLAHLEETQRRTFDPQRIESIAARFARGGETAKELTERARRALSTITVAVRYCAVAVRIVKMLT